MNSVAFVTDEQNARSLCPVEGVGNLVAVRIRYLSVRRMQTHLYPRSSAPLDVYSDMYVKHQSCGAEDSVNRGRRLSSND